MDDQKQQIVEKLQAANNILVTVSSNPSVDQLAACIGLTLMLNKLDKHATAVFSGKTPSTIEFLKPEETIEKNTDSLRDFIIALDKSKADKLRYKVEDKVVKIFITPYRTSLSDKDLNFSQGDFNVDVVLALGVKQQGELDQAITSHGRILHDAVVMCINNGPGGELGSVNWQKADASSLSELVTELAKSFDKPLLDGQIATALMTGIVAETDRFRNEKTAASTMSLSADLMNAGANQQLVAKELDHEMDVRQDGSDKAPDKDDKHEADKIPPADDGTLEIAHEDKPKHAEKHDDKHDEKHDEPAMELPEPELPDEPVLLPEEPTPEIHDEKPTGDSAEQLHQDQHEKEEPKAEIRSMITEPPRLGGTLTANSRPEDDGLLDNMSLPKEEQPSPLLDRDSNQTPPKLDSMPAPPPVPPMPPTPPAPPKFQESELPKLTAQPPSPPLPPQPFKSPQQAYDAPPQAPAVPAPTPAPAPPAPVSQPEPEAPAQQEVGDDVQDAREAVMKALSEQSDTTLPPVEALNAQPVDLGKLPGTNQPLPPNQPEQPPFANSPADQPMTMPTPPGINVPPAQTTPPTNAAEPNTPPPVPPPLVPPPFGQQK